MSNSPFHYEKVVKYVRESQKRNFHVLTLVESCRIRNSEKYLPQHSQEILSEAAYPIISEQASDFPFPNTLIASVGYSRRDN